VAPFNCKVLSACPEGSERELQVVGFLCCVLVDVTLLIIWLWPWLRRNLPGWMRIRPATDTENNTRSHQSTPEKQQPSSHRALGNNRPGVISNTFESVGLDISFTNVTFSIKGAENLILDSVSGKAQRGTLLGVMGPSGSGKCKAPIGDKRRFSIILK
jgi:ABC-type multidrug transport system fused ATPase/permease subunit